MPSAGEAGSRRRVAVVGAGISGLSSAILLQVARAPRPHPRSRDAHRGRAAAGSLPKPPRTQSLLHARRSRRLCRDSTSLTVSAVTRERKQRSGWDVTLYESEKSFGGHTLTDETIPGVPVDLGFQVRPRARQSSAASSPQSLSSPYKAYPTHAQSHRALSRRFDARAILSDSRERQRERKRERERARACAHVIARAGERGTEAGGREREREKEIETVCFWFSTG